jgi:sporulation protein YlmC with PRC-barrel domain
VSFTGDAIMTRTILAATTALVAISGLAFAQEQPADIAGRAAIYESIPAVSDNPAPAVSDFVAGQAHMQLLATDFLGLPIEDTSGTVLGTIDDVLFDESGKLSVLVLNVGDLIGTDKRIAFNLSELRRAEGAEGIKLVAAIDRAKLDAAPNFKSLAEEMELNDGQSLTEDEAKGGVAQPAPSN